MYTSESEEGRKKVLIVGDSYFIRNEFGEFFQEHGYEIASIGSEPEEIVAGIRLSPEVVIVDFEMKFNDPYLVIALLHKALPGSCIALLNGHIGHCNESEAKSAGARKIVNRLCDVSVFNDIIYASEEEVCL